LNDNEYDFLCVPQFPRIEFNSDVVANNLMRKKQGAGALYTIALVKMWLKTESIWFIIFAWLHRAVICESFA